MAEYPYSAYAPPGLPYAKQIATTKRAPLSPGRQGELQTYVNKARAELPQIDAILESLRLGTEEIGGERRRDLEQALADAPPGSEHAKAIQTTLATGREVMGPERKAAFWKMVAPYQAYEPTLESTRLGTEEQSPAIIAAAGAQTEGQDKPWEQFRGDIEKTIPDIQNKYAKLYQQIQESEQAGLSNLQASSKKQELGIKEQMAARGIVGSSFENAAQTERLAGVGRLEADLRARMGQQRAQVGVAEADKVSAIQRLIAQSRVDQAGQAFNQFNQSQAQGFQQWLAGQNLDINLKQLSLQEFNTAFNQALKKLELETQSSGGGNPMYSLY